MSTFGIILVFLAILILAYVIYDRWNMKEWSHQIPFRSHGIEELVLNLENGTQPDNSLIISLCRDPVDRQHVFHVLKSYHKTFLFPDKFYTYEEAAKSNLAHWIQHQSIRMMAVDVIEVHSKISKREGDFYIMKFRLHTDSEIKKANDLIGIAGPYTKDSKPYDWTESTGSLFHEFDPGTIDDAIAEILN